MGSAATASPLVALTIWAALVLYVAGEHGRTRRTPATWSRPVWLLGASAYLAHVAAAFAIHHDWSHAAAYAYTAARTDALIGLPWGGGLWVNYAFTAIWVGEGLWWQLCPAHYARRAGIWTPFIRGTFLFMIVNGAVIFVEGPRRLLGIGVLVALAWIWRTPRAATGYQLRSRRRPPPAPGKRAGTPRRRGAP